MSPTGALSNNTSKAPWEDLDPRTFSVALNGKALQYLFTRKQSHESLLHKVLLKAQVYARMSPDDKAVLVELIQDTQEI